METIKILKFNQRSNQIKILQLKVSYQRQTWERRISWHVLKCKMRKAYQLVCSFSLALTTWLFYIILHYLIGEILLNIQEYILTTCKQVPTYHWTIDFPLWLIFWFAGFTSIRNTSLNYTGIIPINIPLYYKNALLRRRAWHSLLPKSYLQLHAQHFDRFGVCYLAISTNLLY